MFRLPGLTRLSMKLWTLTFRRKVSLLYSRHLSKQFNRFLNTTPLPIKPHSRRKRLVILCDGTWQDGTSDLNEPPSHITRLSRALSRNGYVYNPDGTHKKDRDGLKETMEQVVYYQKGVGTGLLDRSIGGATGLGVSANVRGAYSFLAQNWEAGDEIFIFGFSRGAYTARSVGAMIARYGLLTPLGMDSFPQFYNTYYRYYAYQSSPDTEGEKKALKSLISKKSHLQQDASNSIRIIGVFDTVAAVESWAANLPFLRWLSLKDDSVNQDLPERVTYAFQALALDEDRKLYQPLLWHRPILLEESKYKTPNPGLNDEDNTSPTRCLKQVWFSGVHKDIGGGFEKSALADISLAWMVAECSATRLLEFDDKYLLKDPEQIIDKAQLEKAKRVPWSTHFGSTIPRKSILYMVKQAIAWMTGRQARIPNLKAGDMRATDEFIHASIKSRAFGGHIRKSGGAPVDAVPWPSANLTGRNIDGGWEIKSTDVMSSSTLLENPVLQEEWRYKGRIRGYNQEPSAVAKD